MTVFGIVGAGGFGREVMWMAERSLGRDGVDLCFVVEGASGDERVNGYRVVGLEEFVDMPGEKRFNVAIADSRARERIACDLESRGCTPSPIIAEAAVVMSPVRIGEGCILAPFASVTSNASIGRYFHANVGASVAHDCVVGDYVTVAPGAKCNGNVWIGDHAYVGAGALIKQGSLSKPLKIGAGAVVGMGAVVIADVPDGATVVGNPARPIGKKRSMP